MHERLHCHLIKKKIDELEVENYKKVISMDANGKGVSPIYMEWKYRKK